MVLSPLSSPTVLKRSVFFCPKVVSSASKLTRQRNTLRFGTVWLKWKTAFRSDERRTASLLNGFKYEPRNNRHKDLQGIEHERTMASKRKFREAKSAEEEKKNVR